MGDYLLQRGRPAVVHHRPDRHPSTSLARAPGGSAGRHDRLHPGDHQRRGRRHPAPRRQRRLHARQPAERGQAIQAQKGARHDPIVAFDYVKAGQRRRALAALAAAGGTTRSSPAASRLPVSAAVERPVGARRVTDRRAMAGHRRRVVSLLIGAGVTRESCTTTPSKAGCRAARRPPARWPTRPSRGTFGGSLHARRPGQRPADRGAGLDSRVRYRRTGRYRPRSAGDFFVDYFTTDCGPRCSWRSRCRLGDGRGSHYQKVPPHRRRGPSSAAAAVKGRQRHDHRAPVALTNVTRTAAPGVSPAGRAFNNPATTGRHRRHWPERPPTGISRRRTPTPTPGSANTSRRVLTKARREQRRGPASTRSTDGPRPRTGRGLAGHHGTYVILVSCHRHGARSRRPNHAVCGSRSGPGRCGRVAGGRGQRSRDTPTAATSAPGDLRRARRDNLLKVASGVVGGEDRRLQQALGDQREQRPRSADGRRGAGTGTMLMS